MNIPSQQQTLHSGNGVEDVPLGVHNVGLAVTADQVATDFAQTDLRDSNSGSQGNHQSGLNNPAEHATIGPTGRDEAAVRRAFDEVQDKTIVRLIRELNVWDLAKKRIVRNGWTKVNERWVEDMGGHTHGANALMQRFSKLIKEGKVRKDGEYPEWVIPLPALARTDTNPEIGDERPSPQAQVVPTVIAPTGDQIETEGNGQVEEPIGRANPRRIEYEPVPEELETMFQKTLAATINGAKRKPPRRWRCNDGT
jgi:hypothetical protein